MSDDLPSFLDSGGLPISRSSLSLELYLAYLTQTLPNIDTMKLFLGGKCTMKRCIIHWLRTLYFELYQIHFPCPIRLNVNTFDQNL
jgi:hypothetical protein